MLACSKWAPRKAFKPAEVDIDVDFSHQLCGALIPAYLPPALRSQDHPLSQIIGSLCIKHPSVFGKSDKLDVLLDKGLFDYNLLLAYRTPGSHWLGQHSYVIQHSVAPEIGVYGVPLDNFSRSGGGGVNISRFSTGLDLEEPATSSWSSTTSIRYEHVRFTNDEGRCINRDLNGALVTSSGRMHDDMIIIKTESRYGEAKGDSISQLNFQIEQGVPFLSRWLAFNRFKFMAKKGRKLGPAYLSTRLTGGSIVGDIAPYQAFSIGGLGSVRGYGDGAIGCGRQCLVLNSEVSVPLTNIFEGAAFVDCGTDLGSGRFVPGNPGCRYGKPGSGVGYGCSLRCHSQAGQIQIDYAINSFNEKTLYFSINSGS